MDDRRLMQILGEAWLLKQRHPTLYFWTAVGLTAYTAGGPPQKELVTRAILVKAGYLHSSEDALMGIRIRAVYAALKARGLVKVLNQKQFLDFGNLLNALEKG